MMLMAKKADDVDDVADDDNNGKFRYWQLLKPTLFLKSREKLLKVLFQEKVKLNIFTNLAYCKLFTPY